MTESPDVDPAKVVTHDPPQIVLSHDSPLTLLPYSQATGESGIKPRSTGACESMR